MRWFRFYDDALNNPKVQRLSGELYKAWGNLLCIASKNGGVLPEMPDVAFALRVAEPKAETWLSALIKAELFDETSDGIRPHDWDEWQRESDSAAERMRRHRQRKRDGGSDGGVTSQKASPVQNSDGAEAEQKQTQNRTEAALPARDPRFAEVYARLESILDYAQPFDGSRIHAWLASGADPELDIYPAVIRKRGTGPPKPLKYFDGPIADSIANRTNGLPHGKPNGHSAAKPKRGGTAEIRAGVAGAFADCLDEGGDGTVAGEPETSGDSLGGDG